MTTDHDAAVAGVMALSWACETAAQTVQLALDEKLNTDAVRASNDRRAARAALESAVRALVAPVQAAPLALLSDADMADLLRLEDLFSDGEGWDLPKARMQRLAELGVIRRTSGDRYSITAFGAACMSSEFKFPLRTFAEWNESSRLAAVIRNSRTTESASG